MSDADQAYITSDHQLTEKDFAEWQEQIHSFTVDDSLLGSSEFLEEVFSLKAVSIEDEEDPERLAAILRPILLEDLALFREAVLKGHPSLRVEIDRDEKIFYTVEASYYDELLRAMARLNACWIG